MCFGTGFLSAPKRYTISEECTRHTFLRPKRSRYHLRVLPLRRNDWKYIAAKVGGHAWVNKCDTYGVASAQYYWGRMAVLRIRLPYHTFSQMR